MTGRTGALRQRRRIIAWGWLAAAAFAIGGGVLSLAVFTHEEPLVQPFSVGTISLGLSPADTLFTVVGMVPGDEADGLLTVEDVGTGTLRYAMTVTTTDTDAKQLRDVLHLDVERRTGCSGPVLETLYSGPIGTAAFGNPAAGGDPGDRQLVAGGSEDLCFRATLPAGTDTLYQGATTTVTLTFRAEQVAGNP